MSTTVMAADMASFELTTGRVEKIGTCSLGLLGVLAEPHRARIVLAGRNAGVEWESTQDVQESQVVVANGAWFRVRKIEAAASGARGRVSFDPLPQHAERAVPADAVVLAAGGQLRVDGPDIETATDLRVTAWQPDEHHPAAAQAEAWPALYSRDDTDPAAVRPVHLAAAGERSVGRTNVSVLAVQAASAEHPAWVVLQLHPHSKP